MPRGHRRMGSASRPTTRLTPLKKPSPAVAQVGIKNYFNIQDSEEVCCSEFGRHRPNQNPDTLIDTLGKKDPPPAACSPNLPLFPLTPTPTQLTRAGLHQSTRLPILGGCSRVAWVLVPTLFCSLNLAVRVHTSDSWPRSRRHSVHGPGARVTRGSPRPLLLLSC